jgi:hypothetical protein
MLIKRSMHFFTGIYTNPWARIILLVLYYLAILVGLVILYGKGNFTTPPFIYQGF